MTSYYWLLATLLVLFFDVFYLFLNGIHNSEYHLETKHQSANTMDSIQNHLYYSEINHQWQTITPAVTWGMVCLKFKYQL